MLSARSPARVFLGLAIAVLLSPVAAQPLVSMTICSDDKCSLDCSSWTVNTDSCAPCPSSRGPCSFFNPSAIFTTSELKFFSTADCSGPSFYSAGISIDNKCTQLTPGAYYRATNVSAIIGGVVGGIIALVFVITFLSIWCRRRAGLPACCCSRGEQPLKQQRNAPVETRVAAVPAESHA